MHQELARSPTKALRAHLPFLRRYARALTCDRRAADAVVRDCLRRALLQIDAAPGGRDLRIRLLRLLQREYECRPGPPERCTTGSEGHEAGPPEANDFRAAFERLPPADRQVLLLTGLEGLTAEETAAVLGVDRLTVRSRTIRARKRLAALQRRVDFGRAGVDGRSW